MPRRKRILLIELLGEDPFSHAHSAMYPITLGMARAAGHEARWVVVEAGREARPANPHIVELPGMPRRHLLEMVREFEPTLVVVNEKLGSKTQTELEAAARCALLTLDGGHLGLLRLARLFFTTGRIGMSALKLVGAERLQTQIEASELDYGAQVSNPGPLVGRHYTTVHAGHLCVYQKPVQTNDAYAGVALGWRQTHAGCTFCSQSTYDRRPTKRSTPDPVDIALRQVLRFNDTAPPERRPGKFLIDGISVFHHLSAFVDGLESAGVAGSEFLFNPRVDEFLAQADRLEALMPRLSKAGHTIRLWSMGVENFSPEENERFNKGVRPEQVFEAHEKLKRLEEEWPDAFAFRRDGRGGFAIILFTPWTSPADLALNIEGIRRTEMSAQGDLLVSRLQLVPGTAIARLAKQEALLADAFTDKDNLALPCKKRWDWADTEVPWRFRHEGVASIYQILLRAEGEASLEVSDPLFTAVRASLARRPEGRRNRLTLLAESVALLSSEPSLSSPTAILERLDGLA